MLDSIFEPGNRFGESKWRRERGALWDIGPHALALLLPTLGPIDEHAIVRVAFGNIEFAANDIVARPGVAAKIDPLDVRACALLDDEDQGGFGKTSRRLRTG